MGILRRHSGEHGKPEGQNGSNPDARIISETVRRFEFVNRLRNTFPQLRGGTMRQPILNLCVALVLLLGASVFVGKSLAQANSTINKEKVDLLINGGTVVTMDGDRLILEDGAVGVEGDVSR